MYVIICLIYPTFILAKKNVLSTKNLNIWICKQGRSRDEVAEFDHLIKIYTVCHL